MKIQSIADAFRYAFNGIALFFRHDRNGKIHLLAAVLVTIAAWWLKVSAVEWSILLLCIAVVISLEMLNYAMENLCNLVHSSFHPLVKAVKDVAAAAVLWSAIVSMIIGLIIFAPKIYALL
ncbi:MAG: diacylglycerol kinase family protein [Chitinophagaceae bacterium]|nr:diacylglycerol kinase family protein [Chitinophagaceae bacterium]